MWTIKEGINQVPGERKEKTMTTTMCLSLAVANDCLSTCTRITATTY